MLHVSKCILLFLLDRTL